MDKLTQIFLQRAKTLHDTIRTLLESSEQKTESNGESFAPTINCETLAETLKTLCGPPDEIVKNSFLALMPYFDAGVAVLRRPANQVTPLYAFKKGQFYPLLPQDRERSWAVHPFPFSQVFLLKGEKLKQEFLHLGLIEDTNQSVLTFHIKPDQLVILVSSLPEVFLRDHCSRVHRVFLNYFCEVQDE